MTKVDLGWKTWQEAAMQLFAECCNRCDVKKTYDYKVCEICPKQVTIHRMSCVQSHGEQK